MVFMAAVEHELSLLPMRPLTVNFSKIKLLQILCHRQRAAAGIQSSAHPVRVETVCTVVAMHMFVEMSRRRMMVFLHVSASVDEVLDCQ
ncbi:hypothetical protein XENOCAPTIV_015491 [Xenoophorus captivus]|uniref:Uncharacterized protein n=1 Tax=Xenoophorus captivus TaxID=1517983 RepID=A0ABV0RSU8_9TELE